MRDPQTPDRGRRDAKRHTRSGAAAFVAALVVTGLLSFSSSALAAGPFHARDKTKDIAGLNHACGVATDSKGDLYASSAGTGEVKVYDSSHTLLTSIADSNQPCGLAVTTTGVLYVSEKTTGEVVRFKPNAYPFVGTPTYGAREVIDASTKAKGIAVDRNDNRLYVAAGDHVAIYKADGTFEANVGEGLLTEATGVAAYTYPALNSETDRYLAIADAAGLQADRLYLFGGKEAKTLKLRRELKGANTPDGTFGFGAAGAYLAADPGNRTAENSEAKCTVEGEKQACTAGHLFLYDATHKALDEFDATGEYLDQVKENAAFADASPTALAIDRSGGAGDGTVYVTAGPAGGAKALAFGPLAVPSRKTLKKPSEEAGGLSQELKNARAVATDSHGYVYAAAGTQVHIYKPDGSEILNAGQAPLEDAHKPFDLAIDSTGKVYVLDEGENGFSAEAEVTYYTPSAYPPVAGTTYKREPVVATPKDFPAAEDILKGIAIDPGSGTGKDRLFLTSFAVTHVYKSAANGSELIDSEFAKELQGTRQSIAIYGKSGTVYFGINRTAPLIAVLSPDGKEELARINETGTPEGPGGLNPLVAIDQTNGHVLEYDGARKTAREYDASGSFVAAFGTFSTGLTKLYRVAIDSSCALHEPPLDETTVPTCKAYDPANGTVYVAFGDTKTSHPPYNGVNAFGPLDYGAAPPTPEYELEVKKAGSGSGKVTSTPAGIDCEPTCAAKYPQDTTVTLKAEATSGSKFVKWSGCDAEPSVGECEVWLPEDRKATAEFEVIPGGTEYPLTVKKTGAGKGTVTSNPAGIDCDSECSEETHEFSENLEVALTAVADPGFEFVEWGGACSGTGSCVVTMTEAKEVEAEFDVAHPLLTVALEGSGSGEVSSEPPGIECEPTCSAKVEFGDTVELNQSADPGSKFLAWGGACSGNGACEVTMTEPLEVTATFAALPQAKAKQAVPIAYHEATLRGEVDPSGLASKYHFEYLSEAEYEAGGESFAGAKSTPIGELAPGSGFVAVQASLTGLKEGTEYRFRLLASNSVGPAEEADEEGSFETLQRRAPETCANGIYRFGLSANLPDCRAYELVTPAQTNGATLVAPQPTDAVFVNGFSAWLTPPSGPRAGEALSFGSSATLSGFEGSGGADGYRGDRGVGEHPAGGWGTELLSPSYVQAGGGSQGVSQEDGHSPDQLYSLWEVTPRVSLEGALPKGIYLRTPAGFEAVGRGSLGTDPEAKSRYVSAGGAHVIFSSEDHLEAKAAPSGTETKTIYDRAAGSASAEVVSVKPDGSSFGAKESAFYLGATEDGAAVAFTIGEAEAIYLHRAGVTTEIAQSSSTFAGVSEDGTKVFYAATNDGASPAPLYACDTEAGPCAGEGAHPPAQIAAAGIFALVSPDGSHAFFSSTEALTGAEENENGEVAEAGKRNLYAWDGTETRFVGRLAASDFEAISFGVPRMGLGQWTLAIGRDKDPGRPFAPTRSSADGGAFVFQSHARLSPYDNEGVGEIYRYDPAATPGERLLCVSCDPTGGAPSDDALLEDIHVGNVPGARTNQSPINEGTMIANVTDNGNEVFFQSFDRLLPEDANDVEDVYEWKAKGTGGCTRPGGCLALISSGQGETPSILYAMSADGHDVFIYTLEKLVGQDVAGSPSIYDARVGGGIPEPSPPAPCQGDACQGQGALPPTLPNPASTGGGEGGEASKARACAKGKHRVKGRCVKRHAKKHQRRAKHNRRAHR